MELFLVTGALEKVKEKMECCYESYSMKLMLKQLLVLTH